MKNKTINMNKGNILYGGDDVQGKGFLNDDAE